MEKILCKMDFEIEPVIISHSTTEYGEHFFIFLINSGGRGIFELIT